MRNTFSRTAPQEQLVAVEIAGRVEALVRSQFGLLPAEPVLVRQRATTLPGFPPYETIVEFWTADEACHHFKIFKAAADIVESDLPFPWQKPTLVVRDGYACECC